jgi:hypothetical protein
MSLSHSVRYEDEHGYCVPPFHVEEEENIEVEEHTVWNSVGLCTYCQQQHDTYYNDYDYYDDD